MPRNQMGFLRSVLYGLKQLYPATADIYHESADAVDLTTGVRSVVRQRWRVQRAVSLPTVTAAEALFPLAAKQIWKRDSAVETGSKVLLIDRRDLPEGLRVATHNWSVVVDHRRYEVLKVEEYEAGIAYLVTLKELAGAAVDEGVAVAVSDAVTGVDRADRP